MSQATERFYNEGMLAAQAKKGASANPYTHADLHAYCAWMGGWNDVMRGYNR